MNLQGMTDKIVANNPVRCCKVFSDFFFLLSLYLCFFAYLPCFARVLVGMFSQTTKATIIFIIQYVA